MKLLAYIRVSSQEQRKNGKSLEIQRTQVRRYCQLYEHELVEIIEDAGVSAGKALESRPGGGELVERLLAGEVEGVVVSRLDRAFRLTVDGLVLADRFNRRGVTIHSVSEHIDTTTPMGWYFLTLLLANAELERNRIRERNTETYQGLLAQGRVYGPVPYGCRRVGGQLFRDPETWAVRRMIVRWKEERALSLRVIAAELQAMGVPAPGGGRRWHLNTLRGILRNHDALHHIPALGADNDAGVSAEEGA